jgi:hypothetical protein
MIKAYKLYPVRDIDSMYFNAPSGIDFVRLDKESLGLATPSCPDTFEETFVAGSAPTNYCPIHGFRISEAIGNGVEAVGTGVKETGNAVGKAIRGIGRVFGGLFGGGDKDKEKDKEHRPVP